MSYSDDVTRRVELVERCLERLEHVHGVSLLQALAWYCEDVKALLEVIGRGSFESLTPREDEEEPSHRPARDAIRPPRAPTLLGFPARDPSPVPEPAESGNITVPGSPSGFRRSSQRLRAVKDPRAEGDVNVRVDGDVNVRVEDTGRTGRMPTVILPEGPPPDPAEDSDPGSERGYPTPRDSDAGGTRLLEIFDLDEDDDCDEGLE